MCSLGYAGYKESDCMKRLVITFATVALVLAGAFASSGAAQAQSTTPIRLQLKWVAQAQFAGYYAAVAKGFYKAQGLDVTLKLGGPDVVPEQAVASGSAELGIDWVPSLLNSREQGAN